jgi:hypothetical protein
MAKVMSAMESGIEFLVECPYCQEMVKILNATDGVWSITAMNKDCDACKRFIARVGNFFNTTDTDEEIYNFLMTFAQVVGGK